MKCTTHKIKLCGAALFNYAGVLTNHKNKWMPSVCTELWVAACQRLSPLKRGGPGGLVPWFLWEISKPHIYSAARCWTHSFLCDIVETRHSVPRIDGKNDQRQPMASPVFQALWSIIIHTLYIVLSPSSPHPHHVLKPLSSVVMFPPSDAHFTHSF